MSAHSFDIPQLLLYRYRYRYHYCCSLLLPFAVCHDRYRDTTLLYNYRYRMHPRPVRVEDPRNPNVHLVPAMVVEEQRLGRTLALIVTRTDA